MDDVDVAVVARARDESVPGRARAGRRPVEAQDLRQVVLEVAPGVAALAAIAIAGEVPVPEVERAERADALVLGVALVAGNGRAVVPALGPVPCEVAAERDVEAGEQRSRTRRARRDGVRERARADGPVRRRVRDEGMLQALRKRDRIARPRRRLDREPELERLGGAAAELDGLVRAGEEVDRQPRRVDGQPLRPFLREPAANPGHDRGVGDPAHPAVAGPVGGRLVEPRGSRVGLHERVRAVEADRLGASADAESAARERQADPEGQGADPRVRPAREARDGHLEAQPGRARERGEPDVVAEVGGVPGAREQLGADGTPGLDGDAPLERGSSGRRRALDRGRRAGDLDRNGRRADAEPAQEGGGGARDLDPERARVERVARRRLGQADGRTRGAGRGRSVAQRVRGGVVRPDAPEKIDEHPARRSVGPPLERLGLRGDAPAARVGDPQRRDVADPAGWQRHADRYRLRLARDAGGLGDRERDAERRGRAPRRAQQQRGDHDERAAHEAGACHSPCATAND
jgi:hypothetical protein